MFDLSPYLEMVHPIPAPIDVLGKICDQVSLLYIVWKLLKMSHLNFFLILAFSTNFAPVKIDLSGNTVWPQASGFQNSPKWTIFGIF